MSDITNYEPSVEEAEQLISEANKERDEEAREPAFDLDKPFKMQETYPCKMQEELCPTGFGDCHDCQFFKEHSCEHQTFNLDKKELQRFILFAEEHNYIDNLVVKMLIHLSEDVCEEH